MSDPSNNYLDNQKAIILNTIHELESGLPPYCRNFLSFCLTVKNLQPRTVRSYAYDLSTFFYFLSKSNPLMSDVKNIPLDMLDKLSMTDIQEYLEFLESYKRDGKLYTNSATGRARKLASLKSFYKYLLGMKMVENNPTMLIPTPKRKNKNIIELENDELGDFTENLEHGTTLTDREQKFAAKTKTRDTAIITLLLHTGIRISELVGLDIDDINTKNRSLRIVRKGGNESYVYLDDEAFDSLTDYIENSRGKTDLKAVFISRKGNRMSVAAVERMVKKYAEIIPNKHITPHKLRSTFATHLYRETDDIYLVKDALGHKSINTTTKYADIGNDRRKEVPELIEKAYEKKKK